MPTLKEIAQGTAQAEDGAQASAQGAAEIEGAEVMPQYVNRFQVVVSRDQVRMIFGDAVVGTKATFHSAVVMSLSDALQLRDVLKTLLAEHEPKPGLGSISRSS